MKRIGLAAAALAGLLLSSCASGYEPERLTGGYAQTDLGGGRWQVRYGANGYTTRETAQTYWLYQCAELTLAQGYAGFQIITPMNLSSIESLAKPGEARIIRVSGHGGGGGGGHTYVYVGGGYAGPAGPSASMQGDIQLLKAPIHAAPPKVFDATALRDALSPYVNGRKCDTQNVCPHVHLYLFPDSVGG